MTKLNHSASAECVPCNTCSTTAEAISLLSILRQTAIHAACYIHVPLPGIDIAPATQTEPHPVPSTELPEDFKKMCTKYGYNLVNVVIPQPNAAAAPVPQLPSTQSSNAISVHSASSTDWEEAYGVAVTAPPLDISTVSDANAPSFILPSVNLAPAHVEDQGRCEVPGGLAHRYASQEAAQAAYDEALNGGQVIEVTYNISKHVLTPPSNQPE
ncbi:hypothetical protein L208DRAFT_1381162 [Tricholoma matsutake]|nr:hypothetical protein L208DRAFT_1381162 [Tricholoma matsutake 945]